MRIQGIGLKELWNFLRHPKTPWGYKVFVILIIVYIIWPADLLPDLAPIIGWLDDLGLLAFGYFFLRKKSSNSKSGKEKP